MEQKKRTATPTKKLVGIEDKMPHWKIIAQNINRLVTMNCKRKLEYFREYTKENKVLLLNFTETWLNSTIQEDINIKGYDIYRRDRIGKNGGGVAIYLRDLYEAEKICERSIGGVEMIAINVKKLNIINIVVYRPPDAHTDDFCNIMEEINNLLSKNTTPVPTVIITGDFNFSFIEWLRDENGGCRWEEKYRSGATREGRKQLESLNNIMDKHNLVQIIDEPTRKENTLDLVITNEIQMIAQVDVTRSALSDHDLIELTTNIITKKRQTKRNTNSMGVEHDFWQLNFNDENINWEMINKEIKCILWKGVLNNLDTEESIGIFMEILVKICRKYIPIKKPKSNSKIPKERKRLFDKIKKLKRSKNKIRSKSKIQAISTKIKETESEIVKHKRKENITKEQNVIKNMKENPKQFYQYIKTQENRDNIIGPFKINGDYIEDEKEMCKWLVKQYNSQFSSNSPDGKLENRLFQNIQEEDLQETVVKKEDIIEAIGSMDPSSTAGPDGIPSKFLLKTKKTISIPLELIMNKSLNEGKIPKVFKLAHITPIHKGGSKFKPEQYRPVCLTSHIMKIFERIIKKAIIKHLIGKGLLNPGQHGFVPGRSTQTQLLEHFCDIYEAIAEGVRVDTVYLDFAKAFDKVNHQILMEKVLKHGIKGKIGIWIQEFLTDRKYRVIVNGELSEEQNVLSGVPQGTVLAAILFVIMIADIDTGVTNSTVRCFADDTRSSTKIKREEDKENMQTELNRIYKWAEINKMEFNENKFEQMSFGKNRNISTESYKTSSGEYIKRKSKVKDLGVITSDNLQFREHIESIINACKIKQGNIFRKFLTRKAEPMIQIYKTYIRSKLDYCCIVWSPWQKQDINRIERIQKNFTSKIEGMEDLNYHERLRKLKLYSLERRRERFMIINAWQQLEGIKENLLCFKEVGKGKSRTIKTTRVPNNNSNLIYNCPARKMERLFNILPPFLRQIRGVKTEKFKEELDKWLAKVPDTPKIDSYGASVAAESNSIIHQACHQRK